jgi:hypothetical protein
MNRISVCEAAEATAERTAEAREDLLVFGLCLRHVAVSSTIVSGMRDRSVFVCLYLYTKCMCNYN